MAHILSKKGREIYQTLHNDLQLIIDGILEYCVVDITLVEGHRAPSKQFEYYKKGREKTGDGVWKIVNKSKVITNIDGYKKKGKHNYDPSRAIDVCAYVSGKPHLSWNHTQLAYIAGTAMMVAEVLYAEGKISHKLRWGNDWDMDGDFSDNSLVDAPHLELINP